MFAIAFFIVASCSCIHQHSPFGLWIQIPHDSQSVLHVWKLQSVDSLWTEFAVRVFLINYSIVCHANMFRLHCLDRVQNSCELRQHLHVTTNGKPLIYMLYPQGRMQYT